MLQLLLLCTVQSPGAEHLLHPPAASVQQEAPTDSIFVLRFLRGVLRVYIVGYASRPRGELYSDLRVHC